MSIADGEYEIDVSAFLEKNHASEQDNSLGIRYGFIPDSMDQTSPLTLYQTDQESLIQANTTDSSGDNIIIFEGNPKRLGPSKNPANETYFLTVSPKRDNQVMLKKLNNIIRVSKSRNVAKWERKIELWNKESNSQQNKNIFVPKIVEKSSQKDKGKSMKASKRPPAVNSKIKSNAVIIDSDEESGLIDDGMNDSEFPDIHFDSTPQEAHTAKKATTAQTPIQSNSKIRAALKSEKEPMSKPASKLASKSVRKPEPKPVLKLGPTTNFSRKPSSKTVSQAPSNPDLKDTSSKNLQDDNSNIDIDDDFKDLEDQLREVLEEDGNQIANKSPINAVDDEDDDESDVDDYHYPSLAPIKINFEEGGLSKESRPILTKSYSGSSQSKPMSLKDLVGSRKRVDEDPSSEEE